MATASPVFLVLGGTGVVGKYLLPEIVKQFASCKVLVATRSMEKAKEVTDKLNQTHPGCAQPVEVDIGSPSSLNGIPPFTFLVNLLSTNRMLGKDGVSATADMVRFAVSRGAHYVDADADICFGDWERTVKNFQEDLGSVAPVVLIGTGVLPGMAAPLTRVTSARLKSCESARLEMLAYAPPSISDDWVMITEKGGLGMSLEYRGGSWRHPWFMRAADFGPPYGPFPSSPMFFPEMSRLPTELDLKACSLNVAVKKESVMPDSQALCCLCCKCIPRSTRVGCAKQIIERSYAPLYEQYGNWCVFQCRASGTNAEGEECRVMLRFDDNQGSYHFTAVCTLAAIEQVVDGTIKGNAPPDFAGLRMDADAAVRSVASKASVKLEETVSTGPPLLMISEATAIARSKAFSFFGVMSWLTKFLVFGFSLWAANAAQWQADTMSCKYVLWTLESYMCYYGVWIYFFMRVVICGSAWEKQSCLVRYIDFIWICCGGYLSAPYVAFETCPAIEHGSAVLLGAFVANTLDVFVWQMRMYTSKEYNVALSAAVGGVYARETQQSQLLRPLLGEAVEVHIEV